ncbi:DUF2642 domain-containing protein [Bacillus sp. CGMCC 1.16541]|uniref:DUF2642 domain-containing protein n=1 Tax=Bacillus sp. CGMCC 1.16541 TaxID=2185143 RepID=UPI0013A5A447|nr:DUF2642 domain-containing protein [Bacillus sp. CGMCC 1.16541]
MTDRLRELLRGLTDQAFPISIKGQPIQVSPVDAEVVRVLNTLKGKKATFQTTKGQVSGKVVDIQRDHVVVESSGKSFFIRIAEIVWIKPQ